MNKLLLILLFICGMIFCEDTDIAVELHNIFNKKLTTPLKLDPQKTANVLAILNKYSLESVALDDKLKRNLIDIKNEFKKNTPESLKKLQELNKERVSILAAIIETEKKKLNELSKILPQEKLAFFFILEDSLIKKFKKAINISTLSNESALDDSQ